MQRLDGTSAKLKTLAGGKPMLVNLWATWCAPCIQEMPTLDALAKREAGKLVVVVASQDLEGVKSVKPWWAMHHFSTLQPYLDPDSKLASAFSEGESTSLPMTVLFDKDGHEVWRVQQGMDWTGDVARRHLAEAGVR
jgi:thiol-disulfide isomerase/thioredoxin